MALWQAGQRSYAYRLLAFESSPLRFFEVGRRNNVSLAPCGPLSFEQNFLKISRLDKRSHWKLSCDFEARRA